MPIQRALITVRYLLGADRTRSSSRNHARRAALSDQDLRILKGFQLEPSLVSGMNDTYLSLKNSILPIDEARRLMAVLTKATFLTSDQLGKAPADRTSVEIAVRGRLSSKARTLLEETLSLLESDEFFLQECLVVLENTKMRSSTPVPHVLARQEAARRIGPYFSPLYLRAYLGIEKIEEFTSWLENADVLQVFSEEKLIAYPAFQFRDGKLDPRYALILHEFSDVTMSEWAIADWFTVPQSRLKGCVPRDWLAGRGQFRRTGCPNCTGICHSLGQAMNERDIQEYELFKKPEREKVIQCFPSKSNDYSGFPSVNFPAGSKWYRNHGSLGAWYFDGSLGGRFNLSSPNGTFYLANTEEGAFREWVGPGVDPAAHRRGIHDSLLRDRWVSFLTLPVAVTAADVSVSDCLLWGMLPKIWSSLPYDTPQEFAKIFHKAQFGGIYTPLQYTPEQRDIAVFGEEGPRKWAVDSEKVPMSDIGQKLSVPVWSAPKMSEMKMM